MGIRPVFFFPRRMWPGPTQSWGIQLEIPLPVCGINGWRKEIPILKGGKLFVWKPVKFSVCRSSQMIYSGWYDAWSLYHQILFSSVKEENVCTSIYLVNIHTSTHCTGQHLSQYKSVVPGQMSTHSVFKTYQRMHSNMPEHLTASWPCGCKKCSELLLNNVYAVGFGLFLLVSGKN